MINEGATCETCAYKNTRPPKQCRQCVTRDGHPGWEPAPGIKVEYWNMSIRKPSGKGWIDCIARRPVTA